MYICTYKYTLYSRDSKSSIHEIKKKKSICINYVKKVYKYMNVHRNDYYPILLTYEVCIHILYEYKVYVHSEYYYSVYIHHYINIIIVNIIILLKSVIRYMNGF